MSKRKSINSFSKDKSDRALVRECNSQQYSLSSDQATLGELRQVRQYRIKIFSKEKQSQRVLSLFGIFVLTG